jgi:hypothetical protein
MAKAKLPEALRENIKRFFRQEYTLDQVLKKVKVECQLYLGTEEEIRRCLISLKGKAKDQPIIPRPKSPKLKKFDNESFEDIIKTLRKNMPRKEMEDACLPIAIGVLNKHEGFNKKVERGPSFSGTPFDLFGFKKGDPYIIEVKTSLDSFNYSGETQKWRLRTLHNRIEGLNIAFLQIAVRKGQYKIYFNEQLDLLFFGRKAPFQPIENWIIKKMEKYSATSLKNGFKS